MKITGNNDRSDDEGRPWVGVGSRRDTQGEPRSGQWRRGPAEPACREGSWPLDCAELSNGALSTRSFRRAFCNAGDPDGIFASSSVHRKIPEAQPPAASSHPLHQRDHLGAPLHLQTAGTPHRCRSAGVKMVSDHTPHTPPEAAGSPPLQNPLSALKNPVFPFSSQQLWLVSMCGNPGIIGLGPVGQSSLPRPRP